MKMAGVASDIVRFCHSLTSERQTERKNNIIKLLERLRNADVQRLIDENNGVKYKKKLSWDVIAQAVFNYVIIEADTLKASSKLSKDTVFRRKKDISETFRCVIQIAEKRGPCLKSAEVYSHIWRILAFEHTRELFCNEYTSVLLKNFLLVQAHSDELNVKIWHDLVSVYCECLLKPPSRSDEALIAQTLNQLISVIENIPHVDPRKLISFFSQVFKDGRYTKSESVFGNLVSSLVHFCFGIAIDCRDQLCNLGEVLFPSLLPFWSKSSSFVKEKLIQFFHLQIKAHHPRGLQRREDGAWASDWSLWKKCLEKLHATICSDFSLLSGKIQRLGSKTDLEQKENFIALAVDVHCQMLLAQDQRSSEFQLMLETGESNRKRRKTESLWTSVREGFTTVASPASCIAWLQFLALFIKKHPLCFPQTEYVSYLTALHQASLHCISLDVRRYIVKCLKIMADNTNSITGWSNTDDTNKADIVNIWQKVWSNTLHNFHNKSADVDEFLLLTSLIQAEIIVPREDAYKIFFSADVRVSRESMLLLLLLLVKCPVPERMNHSVSVYDFFQQSSKFLSRKHLIRLILPSIDPSTCTTKLCEISSHITRSSLDVLAHVIISLIQRNPSLLYKEAMKFQREARIEDSDLKNAERINAVEKSYYLATFNMLEISLGIADESSTPRSTMKSASGPIREVCEFLCQIVREGRDCIRNLPANEEFIATSTISDAWLKTCTRYVAIYCKLIVSLPTSQEDIVNELKSLLLKTVDYLLRSITETLAVLSNDKDAEEQPRAHLIYSTLEFIAQGICEGNKFVAALVEIMNVFPRRLLDLCLNCMTDQVFQKSDKRLDVQCDDDESTGSNSAVMNDDFDDLLANHDENPSPQPATANSKLQPGVAQDIQRQKTLAMYDSLRSVAAKLLYLFAFPPDGAREFLEFDYKFYRTSIFVFLEQNAETATTVYYKFLDDLAQHFKTNDIEPTSQDLQIMFKLLQKFVLVLRNSEQGCRKGLNLLHRLLDFLKPLEDYQSLEVRDIAAKLLSAFWTLKNEKYSPKIRVLMTNCFVKILEIDPHNGFMEAEPIKGDRKQAMKFPGCERVSNVLTQLLLDSSHLVRLNAASHVSLLFRSAKDLTQVAPPSQQYQAFDIVADFLTNLITRKENVSKEELDDINANKAATLLLAMKQIALSSTLCEKKALALLFHDHNQRFLDIRHVGKIFRQIAKEYGYNDPKKYLKTHLEYICNDWLKRGFLITKFPCSVVQMDLKAFLRLYSSEIIPYVMFYCNESLLDDIKQKLAPDDGWTELLVNNFDRIIVLTLPYHACQNKKMTKSTGEETEIKIGEMDRNKAILAYEFCEQMFSKEVVNKLLIEKFDEIVVQLLLRMFDPPSEQTDASQFMRETDAPPNPPYFSSYAVKETLEYLANKHQNRAIIEVLLQKKGSIQKVLLSLTVSVSKAKNDRERIRLLCSYRFIVLLLLEDLQNGLGMNWAFFMRDVIYRCCHWLDELNEDSDQSLFFCVFEILQKVTEAGLMSHCQEIGCHVRIIVNCITKFAMMEDEKSRKAMHLLRFIILDNSQNIGESIGDLPPFPDQPRFDSLAAKLCELKNEDCTKNKFDELEQIYRHNRIPDQLWKYLCDHIRHDRRFINEFMRSKKDGNLVILAVLAKMLIIARTYIHKGDARNAQIAIAECIGEIGPIELHALALPTIKEHEDEDDESFFGSNKSAYRHHLVLDQLSKLQTNINIEVAAAASDALRNALRTKHGIQFLKIFDIGVDTKPKLFLYSEPFKPQKNRQASQNSQRLQAPSKPSPGDFLAITSAKNLWTSNSMLFDEWIKELTSAMISTGAVNDEIFLQTASVCHLDAGFAALIFPFLIHDILEHCTEDFRLTLSSMINQYLSWYLTKNVNQPNRLTAKSQENNRKARMIIDVVNFLRKQNRSTKNSHTDWDNNFWLEMKYLDLAKVAFDCSSFFAAVMFVEIWCDLQRENDQYEDRDSLGCSQGSQLEALSSHTFDDDDKTDCQKLLFEAYINIGEPDGFYGVGTGYSLDVSTAIKAYEYEKEFGKALLAQDLEMNNENFNGQLQLAKNLERSGLHQVMHKYIQGLGLYNETTTEFEELQFEAAWRNGVWDLDAISRSSFQSNPCLSESIYNSLVALKEGDENHFSFSIDEAKLTVLCDHRAHSNISTANLYQCVSKLNAVTQLEHYGKQYFCKTFDSVTPRASLENDFKYFELALSLKAAAMKATLAREMARESVADSMKDEISCIMYNHLLNTAILARNAGEYQICERQLSGIRQLDSVMEIPCEWKIEQAKMFWERGETNRALHHLKSLLRHCEKGADARAISLYPTALGLYGHWLAETRQENPSVIIENFMEHAACLLEDSQGTQTTQNTQTDDLTEAYYLLARYADSQYQRIKDYIKSSTFENKQSVFKKVKEEMDRLEELGKSGEGTSSRYYRRLLAQREEDESELQQMLKDRKQFLQKALENYVRCLCSGNMHDLRIFRLCSLWLDNSHEQFVNQIMKECIMNIQSRKFLPLMYQLAARMGTKKSRECIQFNSNLEQLIEKAAKDHPHHVMFIIMALCNVENETSEVKQSSGRRTKLSKKSSNASNQSIDQSRVQSAKSVISRLRKTRGHMIGAMQEAMNAYIELAYYDIQHLKRQTGKFDLPSRLMLRNLKNMQHVAIPTLDIPVDPSCEYKYITHIIGFDATFTHCGGINLPKVITCIGSDGKRRRQLVKGKDDLRQDAVMQQVFEMVNRLLKENPETCKRELRIRSYKVVPLSQRSGIVEWCENTVPLGEYLIGNRGKLGAHQRYYPTDWSTAECRKRLTEGTLSDGKKSKYNIFQEILKNFRPVFRHFFYEKFKDPADWFTKRLAYTRSLASSSIVGYVVGLGDRHVQNILIDFHTAELVHIDLGVAFEQGKQLPTPETIPFRLTRDLVDGLGVAGVEGIFRRCCEKTMELMRSSQESILTIVEVLLYDPLYEWTLSPLKAVQLQQKTSDIDTADTLQNNSTINTNGNFDNLLGELQSVQPSQDDSKNKMAQRVLIRLRQKLDGNEGGSFLSTQGQVNFLIQAARDVKNLCRVFPGWQPWL